MMFRNMCHNIDSLAQDCSISSALAMEILQSCTKLSIYCIWIFFPHNIHLGHNRTSLIFGFEWNLNVFNFLNLMMQGRDYSKQTRSISWLPMPWILASPTHQQSWYSGCDWHWCYMAQLSISTLDMLNCFQDYKRYIHILNQILDLAWPKLIKLILEQLYILSVLHSQYHACCCCSGDLRSQCIDRHEYWPPNWNIPPLASEELI